MIAQKAFDINVKLSHDGFQVIGARGNFHMKSWSANPKISLKGNSGKKLIDISPPKSQRASQSLIALLYAVCYLSDAKKGAKVFYEDKQGLANSIASKHGPEKSNYMKNLISILEDPEFLQDLEREITKPLPEDLTKLQLEIISASDSNILREDAINLIIKNHNVNCVEIENAIDEMRAHPDLDSHRIPGKLIWPTMSICEHQDVVEAKVSSAVNSSRYELESLKKELEITKDELSHTRDYNAKLLRRNVFARIFNKK